MSISTCPQPLFRLLALWLFAKHQQVIAEVTAGLVILAAKLGSIPRLFCHR